MSSEISIVDITEGARYEGYLYRCLAPIPFRRYKKRREYLELSVRRGFHKKLVILDNEVVGQIEYAPAGVSGYPISGERIIVMHCIWVLRRAKGHNLGKRLLADMIASENHASSFATIALKDHWSPWLKREQMEKLGFGSIDSMKVVHTAKHRGQCFELHLMWLPAEKRANPPTWDRPSILKGVDFCLAHPLYHPESLRIEKILETL